MSSEAQVKAAIQQTVAEFGRIDVLVNNAGIGAARPLHGTPLATWERLLAVNLTGTFLPTKHVWKTMQAQGGGS
ncbi:MAG: SDR family NAD(P)-dependent oxidoreductase, partial [Bryobacteraceae bacterium]|nr:SDR family NAD(P)-dependent oxidoreductase [Bryobacteraceae bacterium]